MFSERVQHFLNGKGSTGFLAKVFVEKVLRIQPNINKMYLLVRASNTDLAKKRLQNEVIGTELFRVLREKWGEDFDSFILEKIAVVAGDVSLGHNLGLKNPNILNQMLQGLDIIVNFAASTKFDERFDIAMSVNTMGALHILNFVKNCHRVPVLLHVSTATNIPYVCGEAMNEVVPEEPFEMGQTLKGTSKLDIHEEKALVEKKIDELRAQNARENTIKCAMKDYGIKRLIKF